MLDWLKGLWIAIWRKAIWVAVGAAIGVVFGDFYDQLDAWVRFKILPDRITGIYMLDSSDISSRVPQDQRETKWLLDLKQGGTRVFGTISSGGKDRWKFSGFKRDRFLSLAYGGLDEGGIGTGTITMQRSGRSLFWGHTVAVECIDQDARFVGCPRVVYRPGHSEEAAPFAEFMRRACEQVVVTPPESCKARQTAGNPPSPTP